LLFYFIAVIQHYDEQNRYHNSNSTLRNRDIIEVIQHREISSHQVLAGKRTNSDRDKDPDPLFSVFL